MKTGFIQAFVNLMKPVSYPYHGIISPCYKQSDIPPYIGPDMKPVGEEWVIAWEGQIYAGPKGIRTFYYNGFLYSSDPHPCADHRTCDKNMYYFAEVYLWQREYGEKLVLAWSSGIECGLPWIGNKVLYIYKAWFDYRFCGDSFLFWVYNAGPSSYGRIWKSLTGEYPGYYPFPQKEIIRV